MNLFEISQPRERLAHALARLRIAAGFSQPELAKRLKWSQAKVSRIENAKQVVEVPDVDAWARATGASDQRREELIALAEDAKVGSVSIDRALSRGLAFAQVATGQLEASARTLKIYQPVIVPGLLQTPGYVRQIFTTGYPDGRADIEKAIAARLARQEILYDENRRFEFVIPEAALRWRFGPNDMLLRQLHLIKQAIPRPNVSIGLIAQDGEAPVWHTHGFTVFDDRGDDDPIVTVETLRAVLPVSDREGVKEYQQVFARLQSVAVYGAAASVLLDTITNDLRHGRQPSSASHPE